MNALRRRITGKSSTEPSREGTPDRKEDKRLHQPQKHKSGGKRRTAWIFFLGGIFGIAVAAFFVGNNDMLHITALSELYLDSLLEVLPIGLVNDAKDLQKNEKDAIDYDSF